MNEAKLLELLTTAATIGRNEDSVGQAQVRADITEIIASRMQDEIKAALGSEHGPLTVPQSSAIADIVRAAQGNKRVALVLDDDYTNVLYGIARSIGDENGNFSGRDDDVRDEFLRITSRTGFEHFIKVSELIEKHHNSLFLIDVDFPN